MGLLLIASVVRSIEHKAFGEYKERLVYYAQRWSSEIQRRRGLFSWLLGYLNSPLLPLHVRLKFDCL